jgi:hypothetical protein
VSDALWLLQAALDWYNVLIPPAPVQIPKAQREALTKVKWPVIKREAVA